MLQKGNLLITGLRIKFLHCFSVLVILILATLMVFQDTGKV